MLIIVAQNLRLPFLIYNFATEYITQQFKRFSL